MRKVTTGIKTAAAGMKHEQPKKTQASKLTLHFIIKAPKISECACVKLWRSLMQPAFPNYSRSCVFIKLCSLGASGGGGGLFSS